MSKFVYVGKVTVLDLLKSVVNKEAAKAGFGESLVKQASAPIVHEKVKTTTTTTTPKAPVKEIEIKSALTVPAGSFWIKSALKVPAGPVRSNVETAIHIPGIPTYK